MNLLTIYATSENFKSYVDAYAGKHGLSVSEALEHRTVQNVSEMYGEPEQTVKTREPERRCDT